MEKIPDNKISGELQENVFLEGNMETDEKIWRKLRDMVADCYRKNGVKEEMIKQFVVHNKQVENFVAEFSEKEGFTDKEKEIAILSAIFHDIAKGYGDFLKHGEEGGQTAEKILLEIGVSEGLARSVRLGIERHMGAEGYPAEKAKEAYGENFKYPAYETKVGQMIYECDILTQLTREGFDKILMLRELNEKNIAEDKKRAEEKGMTVNQVRFLSVLDSARKSLELIKTKSVKKYAERLWRGIEGEYKEYL